MNPDKLLKRLAHDATFHSLTWCIVEKFGFRLLRVNGNHHIYSHPLVAELVNLQEVAGEAKPYQIRQFIRLIERYNITLEKTP